MVIIQRMGPIWAMLRVHAKEKFVAVFASWLEGLVPKLCHLGHHMGLVSGPKYEVDRNTLPGEE